MDNTNKVTMKVNKQSVIPIYYQISEKLKGDIVNGKYMPSEKLPAEEMLAEEYRVNRKTIRRSLNKLVSENYAVRIVGRGTFVAPEIRVSKHIAVILGDYPLMEHVSMQAILSGIAVRVKEEKHILHIYSWDHVDELVSIHSGNRRPVDGALLLRCYKESSKVLSLIEKSGIPFIHQGTASDGAKNFLEIDNLRGMRKVIQHLYDLGHRRFGLVFPVGSSITSHTRSRIEIVKKQLEAWNCPLSKSHYFPIETDVSPQQYEKEMERVIRCENRPSAYICVRDDEAVTLLNLALKYGFNVPEDFSVTGFEDMPAARYTLPSLTTIRQDYAELGYEAASQLIRLINDYVKRKGDKIIPELIIRGSTGTPAKREKNA